MVQGGKSKNVFEGTVYLPCTKTDADEHIKRGWKLRTEKISVFKKEGSRRNVRQ